MNAILRTISPSLRSRVIVLLAAPVILGLVSCGSPDRVSMTGGGTSGAGASAQEPAPTTPPAPTEVLLGDLTRLSSSSPWQHGDVKINTVSYTNGVWATTPCHPRSDGAGSVWDFDLNRQYNRFTAVLGLSDESPVDAKVKVEIMGDGVTNLGSFDLALGVPAQVDVSLTNILRLSIKFTQTTPSGPCDPSRIVDGSRIAFGDAKILT